MDQFQTLSPRDRLKYNPLTAFWYRRYFINRALKTGEAELLCLSQLASPDRIALDIGSNKGVYSYLLADKLGITTHAFEPQPVFYERLRRTAPSNLSCHNVALGDSEAELTFYLPVKNGKVLNQVATLRDVSGETECIKVPVRTTTLDSLNLTNVGFIKIDVEGWEQQVMIGGKETISRDKPVMLIEIEEAHTGKELWESLRFFESFGYKVHGYHDGKIQPLEDFFDIEKHHRNYGSGRYYNNFIFLPD